MAQSGYTPLLIYGSGTTGAIPLAANLTSSSSGAELALNYFDGKLFYKDASGNVQVLATKGAGTIGGSNTQVQYNSSGALAGSANLTFDGTTLTANSATISTGNLSFSSTAQRITGDTSNATLSNRLALQNSVTNGNTSLNFLPNGTATISSILLFNNSDPTNAAYGGIFTSSTEVRFQSARTGSGTYLPLTVFTNGIEQARFDLNGNFLLGTTSNGADGLGISNILNLTFPEGGFSYANLFRQASSGATVIANGYKRSATALGFASSIGTSWAKTAIGLGVGTGDITFYADPAGTVANGTDVTPSERLRVKSTGQTRFLPLAADPSGAENGDVYYNSTTNKLRVRAGGLWVDLH